MLMTAPTRIYEIHDYKQFCYAKIDRTLNRNFTIRHHVYARNPSIYVRYSCKFQRTDQYRLSFTAVFIS